MFHHNIILAIGLSFFLSSHYRPDIRCILNPYSIIISTSQIQKWKLRALSSLCEARILKAVWSGHTGCVCPSVMVQCKPDQRQEAMRPCGWKRQSHIWRGGGWLTHLDPRAATFEGSGLFWGFCWTHIILGIGKEKGKGPTFIERFSVPGIDIISFKSQTTLKEAHYFCLDEDTDVQRGEMTCPKSNSYSRQLRSPSRSAWLQSAHNALC